MHRGRADTGGYDAVDAGIVLVLGNVSFSLIQKELSPLIHDVSDQTVGNISLTYSW